MTYHTCSARTAKSCDVKILYIHLSPHIFIYFHTNIRRVVGMTLESPGMGKKATIHSEHSDNTAYFRCSICVKTSHALTRSATPGWWLFQGGDGCAVTQTGGGGGVGALGALSGLSHPHHPAHPHLCVLVTHGPTAAATQRLLKHPQSLICFTMANGNTILYMYTSQAKSLKSWLFNYPHPGVWSSCRGTGQQVFQSPIFNLFATYKHNIQRLYCPKALQEKLNRFHGEILLKVNDKVQYRQTKLNS